MQYSMLALILVAIIYVRADEELVRQTSCGEVKGTIFRINNSITIEHYFGIPYAEPPEGDLRFRPPIKHRGWQEEEPYDATHFGEVCPHILDDSEEIIGDEDCLNLNVYVPRLNDSTSSEMLAVLFWIHDKKTAWANSAFANTQLPVYANIILVTFNYRLGPLGFLSTGDNKAPGNYALQDQVAALHWVKENIHNFGGDRNRITVAGSSWGAISAQLLAISKIVDVLPEDQLFHRIIAQSGSSISSNVIDIFPESKSQSLFTLLQCPTYSNVVAIECTRRKDFEEIVKFGANYSWDAVKDGNILASSPEELVHDKENLDRMRSRYQFLIGVNTFDSLASFASIDQIADEESFLEFMNTFLDLRFENSDQIADAVFFNYLDWNQALPGDENEWKNLAINATRDMEVLAPSVTFANLASADEGFRSATYFYFFMSKAGSEEKEYDWVTGAKHGDELYYLFGVPLSANEGVETETSISLEMMRSWGNFVSTGNPNQGFEITTAWPMYSEADSRCLVFGEIDARRNISRVDSDLEKDKVQLWSKEIPIYENPRCTDDTNNDNDISEPIVNTTGGRVKGLRIYRENYVFDRFFRIPYAAPPEGSLRFKRPERHSGWEGILDCSDRSSAKQWLYICPQRNIRGNSNVGREDCLHMNIYVPGGVDVKKSPPLPVMVWIYGGGNQIGTNIGFTFYYDMEAIITQGSVIGVTFNYRLNVLGFLSTDDEASSGNMGLFDQIAALKWIQENIANFGGDPDKVTIFGQSAGGASVSLHMISPLSENLFLRGISQSGSLPATWTYSSSGLSKTQSLGRNLGCPVTTNTLLVECLRYKPLKELIAGAVGFGWGTVVDGYFLPSDPKYQVNASRHKDYLVGHNSMEGHGTMSGLFPKLNLSPERPGSNMDRDDVRRASRIYDFGEIPEHVSEAVAYKYIDWNEPESAYLWPRLAITYMSTDWTFAMGSFLNAEIRAESGGSGRTFVYVFGEKSRVRIFPEWVESNHLRELVYTFGHPFEQTNIAQRFSDSDRELSRAMMTYWTNFAWSGDPNYPNDADIPIAWPEYKTEDKVSILFNTTMFKSPQQYIRPNYMGDRYHMWRQILYRMNDLPLDRCEADTIRESISLPYSSQMNHELHEELPTYSENCPNAYLVRNTMAGCIEGIEHVVGGKVTERYLGVPYAEPPLGNLRFANPIEKAPWNGTLPAKEFSKICPQAPFIESLMDEDCLYLSIYVPRGNNLTQSLAVMVWVHGGGNQVGDGMSSYQGDVLATFGNIIVVTINYRLGSLGFLTTDDAISPGNYALFDQHLAFQWVKQNIAFFGGDPDQITIAGQSAGAENILYQTLSPLTDELAFQRAVVESSADIQKIDTKQFDSAVRLGEEASCDTTKGSVELVSCLRALNVNDLISAQARTLLGFYPTIDGVLLPDHPSVLASDGNRISKWTRLMGANSGDGSAFWPTIREVSDEIAYHEIVNDRFYPEYGWRTGSIDEQYANYEDATFFTDEKKIKKSLVQLFGDEMFIFPMHKLAIDYSAMGSDVYFYYFTYAAPADGPAAPPQWIGARHSSEVPFVFGEAILDPAQGEPAKELSRKMMGYWSNFIKNGNPNIGDNKDELSVNWPVYKDLRTDRNYIELNTGNLTESKSNLRPTDDAFWNDYMIRQSVFCEIDASERPQENTDPPKPNIDRPSVKIDGKEIHGVRVANEYYDVNIFYGIPYAKPPVGDLRFQNTSLLTELPSSIDGTMPIQPCLQLTKQNEIVGTEDCLHLDIFLRTGNIELNSESMPILIWVHGDSISYEDYLGGGFWSGGGSPGWMDGNKDSIDPSYLAHFGNLLIIRPNFRLGSLGFLTTGDDVIKGNFGLWDLKAVVEWAVKFGSYFGGNTDQITVMGQGSGAVLAQLLGILPDTGRHIKRIISQSGSIFSPWAYQEQNLTDYDVTYRVLSSVGCDSKTEEDLLSCLRAVDAKDIVSSIAYIPPGNDLYNEYNNWGTWGLRQDGELIPKSSIGDLFAGSSFDFMTGTTSHEFYSSLQISNTLNTTPDATVSETYRFLAEESINYWPKEVGDLLVHSYTPFWDLEDIDSTSESNVFYYSDLMFQAPTSKSLLEKRRSVNASMYHYVLAKKSRLVQGPSWLGATHGEDIPYVFGAPITLSATYNDNDRDFSREIMSRWSNFIWFGDPNTKYSAKNWLPFGEEGNYLVLDDTDRRNIFRKTTQYNEEKSALWNEIVPQFSPDHGDAHRMHVRELNEATYDQEICDSEPPPIGTGIGLNLTPAEADAAIYTLFSFCLLLGALLLIIVSSMYIRSRKAIPIS